MAYIFFGILYQLLMHYFDWRHLFRAAPPKSVFLIVNYSVGLLGISLTFLGWWYTKSLANWVLLTSLDAGRMFILVVLANGLPVILAYCFDAVVLNKNRSAEQNEENAQLRQRNAELEQELAHAKNQGA